MSENTRAKVATLALGPLAAAAAGLILTANGFSVEASIALGVTVLCVIWWIFETLPIPVTSIVPLALFPMLGVLTMQKTSASYGHPLILLLLGGFILSTAMEKSGAHRRLALTMVRLFGGSGSGSGVAGPLQGYFTPGRRLVFGFMLASAALSMWISNTATTLMLLPVALAVLERSEDPDLPIPLLLGIAYGASVGGIGTPIGTPPNVVFMGIYQETVGEAIGFAEWMSWAIPVVLVLLPIVAFWLTRRLGGKAHAEELTLPEVGPWSTEERRVLTVFGLTALAWVTRTEPFGGWSGLLDVPYTHDSTVALIAVVAMFVVGNGKGGRLLDWETAAKIPWGMLILFGAGISIAAAFGESGLSAAIGNALSGLSAWPIMLVLIVICLAVTFLTETTSNTATTTLLMPILAAAAIGAAIDPRLLMIPAAMSASCAFMLPVATPPNVVVFSTGGIPLQRMAREGLVLNFIGAAAISTLCYLLIA